jgi:DNA-directed RNA polymerase subunit RPC12/RpoP
VGADQDLLFGRIALHRKFCTQEQLDACLFLQANSRDQVPIGQFLLREGYLTEDQHVEILTQQRKRLAAIDPIHKVPKEAVLLGRLALKEQLLTEVDLNVCLRLQAQSGEKRTIGEILVAEGYLTPDQVKALLARQQKKIMNCMKCLLSFTVLTVSKTKVILCPRCKGPLAEGKPSESVRTDAELETAVAATLKKAEPKANESVRMVKMTCPMCGKPFVEPVDSKGRVNCPRCQSSFSA